MSGPAGQVGEAPAGRVVEFAVAGMTCAACSVRLEKVLNRQPGMQATVNLASERARVRLAGSADEAAVIPAVGQAGFSAAWLWFSDSSIALVLTSVCVDSLRFTCTLP